MNNALTSPGSERFYLAGMLLAVHAAISLASALLMFYGIDPQSDDHVRAARELRKICSKHKVEASGIKHLESLLKAKTPVAYGSFRFEEENAYDARRDAQRFQDWANKNFKGVMRAQE